MNIQSKSEIYLNIKYFINNNLKQNILYQKINKKTSDDLAELI